MAENFDERGDELLPKVEDAPELDLDDLYEAKDLLVRINKDLRESAKLMARREAKFLVRTYYQFQQSRLAATSRIREAAKVDEPMELLTWSRDNAITVEKDIKAALDVYAKQWRMGLWMQGICGIGPVISAGMLALLDIRRRPTVGHWWRHAGLDPTVTWGKGELRPWNATLKVLCYHAGECFFRTKNHDSSFYGKLFDVRKEREIKLNEEGKFADQAAFAAKKVGKSTDAYKSYSKGKLPKAHIHARARRWTAKLFLSHLHTMWYREYYEADPPFPFVFVHCDGDHRHYIAPPEVELRGGRLLTELLGPEDDLNQVDGEK
jgi:hypothetical protein